MIPPLLNVSKLKFEAYHTWNVVAVQTSADSIQRSRLKRSQALELSSLILSLAMTCQVRFGKFGSTDDVFG
jgi:hypothetical protein